MDTLDLRKELRWTETTVWEEILNGEGVMGRIFAGKLRRYVLNLAVQAHEMPDGVTPVIARDFRRIRLGGFGFG